MNKSLRAKVALVELEAMGLTVDDLPGLSTNRRRALIAAALDNDADRLLQVFIEHGFTRAGSGAPSEKLLAWFRQNFAALTAPQPFTFTPEFVAELLGRMAAMDKDVMRHMTVPRDFVFTNRLFIGLYSVLAALGSTADWRAMFYEDLTGTPTTELGRIDADFFDTRAQA